ncbi:MAG: ATP-dependent helicase HrpB [Opitutales bacterium]|nr:ATP-dependent helicase HrpB [Opitutales bacterium]
MDPATLPIQTLREELRTTLQQSRRFILQAPTGSGKSTQIPQMLADNPEIGSGMIIVLQPRRIAARMLARRIAQERGERLGEGTGYQVRFEKHWGPKTRILLVTEGILLRKLLEDPSLPGVSAVLFDEFHERHLYGDITLAQALQIQKTTRPDLYIGVMSATLETETLQRFMEPCAILQSEGRTFPVDIYYNGAGTPTRPIPVWERAAKQFNKLAASHEGDCLIFMPGAYEIRKTIEALSEQPEARGCAVLALHGELPPEQQDAVLEAQERRKIIVATNVAETSLTIDGIRMVIDSGQARIPSFDPHRGINTILIHNISRASADQRAGRAGRTAPGVCMRLWSEQEHQHRPAQELAEVRRLELSEILLSLKALGYADLATFPWFEAPEALSLQRAENLLHDLGALKANGSLSDIGKTMASFPLHPRYARMLLEAEEHGCVRPVALIAALSQGRDVLMPLNDRRQREKREDLLGTDEHPVCDFFIEMRAWQLAASRSFNTAFCREWGLHAQSARQAGQLMQQFVALAQSRGLKVEESSQTDETDLRRCLLTGFSDQLALQAAQGSSRCYLVHQRKGERRQESVVKAPLFISADIEERNARGEVVVFLGKNTAIERAWLQEIFPEDFSNREETCWDADQRRVVCRKEVTFRDLVLERQETGTPSTDEAARLLGREVMEERLLLKNWTEATERWILRMNFVARHFPEYEIAPLEKEDRLMILEQICYGAVSYKEIKNREVMPHLQDWLTPEQLPLIDLCAPDHYTLPKGHRSRLRYGEDGSVTVSATIQQLYDAPDEIRIADRVPAIIELLAPNRRPVQVTRNLGAFWNGSYPEIRKALKGRYPKHEWR